ncbi:P2 family phage major capsid protein [Salmonella enterica]|nr:hypothetical protein [Salmonella enterica]EGN1352378.1 P2 family phage major capsid protein [Salmonella enterica]EGQ5765564.1 P2 family phage major capsid protein [Salmonella enterica]EGQ5768086.1 P2 family phage major capsid protein [Salmonella enterica]
MYAFKTERPDAARRYHNKFVTGTNYQEESNRRFALSEPTENILRTSILESGWLIKNITLRDVNAVSGNAVNIGASELHTGRVDGGRFHKKMAINGTEFFLTETDTCARISYSDMSHIYHIGHRTMKMMRMYCPTCQAVARIGKTNRKHPQLYDVYCYCSNVECGHSFVMNVAFSHSVSPSALNGQGRVKELIDAIPPEEREKALKLLLAAQKNG